ncbi:MAG: GH3 auxin-responsive promoter family protein, partial [Bacteroidota bacterium]
MISGLCNHLWALSGIPETIAFHAAAAQPEETQKAVLRRILRRNAGTDFGRSHGFGEIDDWNDFQRKVPLASWEDLI